MNQGQTLKTTLRTVSLAGLVLAAGCVAEREQAKQHEAVEYEQQQHDSARCADMGTLPGSTAFADCMKRMGEQPVQTAR